MSRVLSGYTPKRIFEIFEDICAIPHGSGNTGAISDYCVRFADERGLQVRRDSLNNVIIKKEASAGCENAPAVVLQGHLDMVCEKDSGIDFDFNKDALRLKVEGDYLSASGTTLGADDGVAVAMALAVLDDEKLRHPPLYVIFTTDEEVGMYGAAGIDVSDVDAKRFISLDCATEGNFTVSCAGGVRVDVKLPLETEKNVKPACKVEVSGLIGGHSGEEIDKGRLNANKVLGKFLSGLENVNISEISGGMKDNAIPTSAYCVLSSDSDVASMARVFENENRVPTDSGLKLTVTPLNAGVFCTGECSEKIIGLLCALPYGIQAMDSDIKGLVKTSLNVGIIRMNECSFDVTLSVRSSKGREKAALAERLKEIGAGFGAAVSTRGDYPAWEYRKNSPLRDVMSRVYREIYGKDPKIKAIHAGLECGLFSGKIADIDAVSTGPDMFDIHTPRERLSISSFSRTYNYLCRVLEALV